MSRSFAEQRGFTLLEAIVALVLMATTLLALYSWLANSTFAITRVRDQTAALADARTALALIRTVNPAMTPEGERQLAPITVRWTSQAVGARRPGLTRAGFPTPFDFTLYEMRVEVLRGQQRVRDFTVRRTGWIEARPYDPGADL